MAIHIRRREFIVTLLGSAAAAWPSKTDAIEGQIVDQRPGQWTRLQLMEMDAAFCPRMRRAHPEREIGVAAHLVLC